jgi:hypothetical protein
VVLGAIGSLESFQRHGLPACKNCARGARAQVVSYFFTSPTTSRGRPQSLFIFGVAMKKAMRSEDLGSLDPKRFHGVLEHL